MQTARCQMGVAVLDRYLYVVGGNNVHQEVLNTVERYSFDEDKWTSCTPMSVGRASPAVASADGLLYVAGGDQVIGDFIYVSYISNNPFVLPDLRSEFLPSTNHGQCV
jgi:N-acetylneuraminic acid mutarotase